MKRIIRKVSDKITSLKRRRGAKGERGLPEMAAVLPPGGSESAKPVEVLIPTLTIIKVLLVVAGFFALQSLIIEIQNILIMATIAFFLAIGLSPIVNRIEQLHLPRPLAILVIYIFFFGVLGLLFIKVIPIIVEQLISIASEIKAFIQNGNEEEISPLEKLPIIGGLVQQFSVDMPALQRFATENLTSITRNLQGVAGSTFNIVNTIFQSLFNMIFTLVILFFILMEREHIGHFALQMLPASHRKYVKAKFTIVQTKMAEWFRGQMILMVSVGLFMYVGMKILEVFFGMKYAATIGLVAGVMELFPYIGVTITGLLAGVVALNVSLICFVLVVGWMFVTQFLEGNILVPIVMERAVGLSSVVVILAVSIGATLGNAIGGFPMAIVGMILAVPTAASIAIFVEEYVARNK